MSSTNENLIQVESAVSGRASCRGCSEKIDKGVIRIGIESWISGRKAVTWQHTECFFPKALSLDICTSGRGKCKYSGELFLKNQIRLGVTSHNTTIYIALKYVQDALLDAIKEFLLLEKGLNSIKITDISGYHDLNNLQQKEVLKAIPNLFQPSTIGTTKTNTNTNISGKKGKLKNVIKQEIKQEEVTDEIQETRLKKRKLSSQLKEEKLEEKNDEENFNEEKPKKMLKKMKKDDKLNSILSLGGKDAKIREELVEEYLYLTKKVMPEEASKYKWCLRLDHCFQRVCLDNMFQGCWYNFLSQKKPAKDQLSISQLRKCIEVANDIISDKSGLTLQHKNNFSLQSRGKKIKAIKN